MKKRRINRHIGPFEFDRSGTGAIPTIPGVPTSVNDLLGQLSNLTLGNFNPLQPAPGIVPGLPAQPALPEGAGSLGDLIGALPIGTVLTPWAVQKSDVKWDSIGESPVNYAVQDIGIALTVLQGATVGMPLTIAFMSKDPRPLSLVQAAFAGTAYAYSSTQACYAQTDPNTPPSIIFLHWGTLRNTQSGSQSLELSAASIGAKAVFAYPIDSRTSTSRGAPGGFGGAYQSQYGITVSVTPAPNEVPPPSLPPLPPPVDPQVPIPPGGATDPLPPGTTQPGTARAGMSWGLIGAVGGLSALIGYGIVWAWRR